MANFKKWITLKIGYTAAPGALLTDPIIPNEYAIERLVDDACDVILEYGTASTDIGYSNNATHKITMPYLAATTGVDPIYVQTADGAGATNANGRLVLTAGSNIGIVHPGLNDTTWNTGAVVSRFTMNGTYQITPYSPTQLRRNIIFEGTSISNFNGALAQSQYMFPLTTFSGLTAGNNLCFHCLAKGDSRIVNFASRFTDQMQYLLESAAVPHIVFVEAPTNDIANRTVGYSQIYTEWKAYVQGIINTGNIVIAGTMIARNHPADVNYTNIETDRLGFNATLRADADFTGKIADFAALSQFDTQSDCSNTTNYTDSVHPTDTGYALLAACAAPVINSNL